MKAILNKLLVVVFFVTGLQLNAQILDPQPVLVVEEISSERFKLQMQAYPSAAYLDFIDELGYTLYSEMYKKAQTSSQVFDIAQLPEGAYFLKINAGNYAIIYKIKKQADNLEVLKTYAAPKIDSKTLALLMN